MCRLFGGAVLVRCTLLVLVLGASGSASNAVRGPGPRRNERHAAAIRRLRELVPPPSRSDLGGDEDPSDDECYARFLSVSDWDPEKTAPKIQSSFEWRGRVKPGSIRPEHCPKLSRQHAWLALTTGPGSNSPGLCNEADETDTARRGKLPLDPPYNCPPLQRWRTTRHGLPITYFRCWRWRPSEASSDNELEKHMAYHMAHLIRRMPRNVSRICVVFDMRGFERYMLPYIHRCVNILRTHYPGRAGAMVFINVPFYFKTVWKVISPWLDDEIRSKTFFAPEGVDNIEKVIDYVNKKHLKV